MKRLDMFQATVVILNVHVPRPWQDQDNAVLAAATRPGGKAQLVDWDAVATAHPQWFWNDGTHLRGFMSVLHGLQTGLCGCPDRPDATSPSHAVSPVTGASEIDSTESTATSSSTTASSSSAVGTAAGGSMGGWTYRRWTTQTGPSVAQKGPNVVQPRSTGRPDPGPKVPAAVTQIIQPLANQVASVAMAIVANIAIPAFENVVAPHIFVPKPAEGPGACESSSCGTTTRIPAPIGAPSVCGSGMQDCLLRTPADGMRHQGLIGGPTSYGYVP